jgi:hypothetical protein
LLSKYYNNSPSSFITSVFPEYQLLPWKFTVCNHNFWKHVENQRKFLIWAGEQLGIKESSDWYKITVKVRRNFMEISKVKDILQLGGASLLNTYKGSPSLLINTIFPAYQLLPWKFTHCSRNYWDNAENQRKFMDWAAQHLGIKDYGDWYKVVTKVTRNKCRVNILGYYTIRRRKCTAIQKWEIVTSNSC